MRAAIEAVDAGRLVQNALDDPDIVAPLQAATRFAERPRSFWAKYPGQTAESLRKLAAELMSRLAEAQHTQRR